MKTPVTVLNVRQGIIEENNQHWAHANIIDGQTKSEESIYGVNIAKLKFTDSQIAVRLISDLRKANIKMPCSMNLELETVIQSNEMKMVISSYELPKQG